MSKTKISKGHMRFLDSQLKRWQAEEIISEETADLIAGSYDVERMNFIRIVLIIGALLVGLGVLSFVASNWAAMGKLARFGVIVGFYYLAAQLGYRLQGAYPRTARSLIYLSGLIYGAGIFLVGQMFNLGGPFSESFCYGDWVFCQWRGIRRIRSSMALPSCCCWPIFSEATSWMAGSF